MNSYKDRGWIAFKRKVLAVSPFSVILFNPDTPPEACGYWERWPKIPWIQPEPEPEGCLGIGLAAIGVNFVIGCTGGTTLRGIGNDRIGTTLKVG